MKRISTHKKTNAIILALLLLTIQGLIILPLTSAAPPDWDVNNDGVCNLIDFIKISNRMGQSGTPGWIREDVDKNGHIEILDLVPVSNNYGNTYTEESMPRIQKLSISYLSSINLPANQQFLAEHFDLISCGKTAHNAAANIKTLNPDITILGYYCAITMHTYYSDWDYVNQYENWFVHDNYGNRVRASSHGGYLMNPAPNLTPNAPYHSWSDYYAQKSKQFLINNPHYDGIFADNVAMNLSEAGYSWTVPYNEFPQNILNNWGIWTIAHIQNLQTTIGNSKIIPNAWKWTQICNNVTGIHFWEGFIHGRNHELTQAGYGEYYTLYAIDTLHTQAEKGKVIAVLSGTKNADNNPILARQHMLFTLACFLFAVEDMSKSYYGWNFFDDDASHGWYPEMDYKFGNPI
ncbi:MAG: putative glycoside hydrolase, partial [Candidatus Thermoplasmatota archaeon]